MHGLIFLEENLAVYVHGTVGHVGPLQEQALKSVYLYS